MSFTDWSYVQIRSASGDPDERGLYAARRIPRGTVIGCFDGRASWFPIGPDGKLLTEPFAFKDLIQLERQGDRVLALAPVDGFDGIDCVNHSCHANAELKRGVVVVARRSIKEGEEILLDYRKMDVVPEGIRCWCAEPRCMI